MRKRAMVVPRWLLATGLALLAGCLGPVASLYPPAPLEPQRSVYVADHGWHTGIVLRHADVDPEDWPERSLLGRWQYLEVGWGDRDYYQADKGTPALALRAAVASGASALHVVAFEPPPAEYFATSELVEVALSLEGFRRLCRFIHASYARNAWGHVTDLGPGTYPVSRFYLATGRYHLLDNCNNWTAKALRSAGCPITPATAWTTSLVMMQVRELGTPAGRGGS